ncbi:Protein Lin-28 A [Manis pentadactyla]|nr:Protein Lin-28 A [Manis pentadactyla]
MLVDSRVFVLHKHLPDFQRFSFSLKQSQPFLHSVRLTNPGGLFPCLWDLTSRLQKKTAGYKERDMRQG